MNFEAPPGFEPGMEVLQGHPRLFSRDRHDGESGLKSYRLIVIRESALGAHRVWGWSKLVGIGSPRAQFGHSSNSVLIEFDHRAVIPLCAPGEHSGSIDFKIEKLRQLGDADARSRLGQIGDGPT